MLVSSPCSFLLRSFLISILTPVVVTLVPSFVSVVNVLSRTPGLSSESQVATPMRSLPRTELCTMPLGSSFGLAQKNSSTFFDCGCSSDCDSVSCPLTLFTFPHHGLKDTRRCTCQTPRACGRDSAMTLIFCLSELLLMCEEQGIYLCGVGEEIKTNCVTD